MVGPELFNPAPYIGCSPLAASFTDMHSTPSSASNCTVTNKRLNNGYHTLMPGTYCKLKPQSIATVQPGAYVIKDGVLNVQGGGEMTLRGRKEGHSDEGFLFIQDEHSNPGGQQVDIEGGSNVKMEGILYTPTWQVSIGGKGTVNQHAKFRVMMADSFHVEGNSPLHIHFDAASIGLPNLMPRIKNGSVILN